MLFSKYSFSDIRIGDIIITTNDEEGEIVAIRSYSYINDKVSRKSKRYKLIEDIDPFTNDITKHKDIWYLTITIACGSHLIGIDFNEIKYIKRNNQIVNMTIFEKAKNLFNKIYE